MKYEFITIEDMALTRADCIQACLDNAPVFIEHFHKIFMSPKDINVNHWCDEMYAKYKKVSELVLKNKNKRISDTQLEDWFFTKGSSVEVLFPDNINEQKTYVKYYKELLRCKDVKNAFVNIGLI